MEYVIFNKELSKVSFVKDKISDTKDLNEAIKFKTIKEAEDYLKSYPNVYNYTIWAEIISIEIAKAIEVK